jgi:hypothetical protein
MRVPLNSYKKVENMSDPDSQDRVRATRNEIDLSLSKHGTFGVAICWLAFYALAVVSAVWANFNQTLETTMAALQ